MGGRSFGQIIRKRERRRSGRIMQRWMRRLRARTGGTGEIDVMNIWEKGVCARVCVFHREVVASGRRLLGQRENWTNKREMMLLHTHSKAWEEPYTYSNAASIWAKWVMGKSGTRKLSDSSRWREPREPQITWNKNSAALPNSNFGLFSPLMVFMG